MLKELQTSSYKVCLKHLLETVFNSEQSQLRFNIF